MIQLRWRAERLGPTLRWRGPAGMAEAIARAPTSAAAGLIAPPGPQGERGPGASDPVRINASLASTWVLPNPFGRIPLVQVFIGNEPVLTDVQADPAHITVTFPSPQQGFVLAS